MLLGYVNLTPEKIVFLHDALHNPLSLIGLVYIVTALYFSFQRARKQTSSMASVLKDRIALLWFLSAIVVAFSIAFFIK